MYHYLYERNKDYLDNNAIEYFGTELTYGELIKQIDICANALFEHGVRKGDIISICTLTMPETVYLLYGANKIGAVCNMIGLNSSIEDLNVQLKLTESKYLFVVEMAYEKLIEASIDTDVKMIVSIPLESSMPLIMSGYYKEPDETEKVLFYENGEKWLHTGDLGVVSENGSISITGRLKRIYWCKKNGMVVRVYPMRIEEIICRLGFVDKCTVVGKKDNEVGYRSIAFVILADKKLKDNNMVIDQITDYCRKNLPANHIPDEYVFVNSFPLTRAGKVDYRELEKIANEKYNG